MRNKTKISVSAAKQKGGESLFAVCPECENPIQIIGLFKDEAEANGLYGRHFKKAVPGISDYYDCSYSDPKYKKSKTKRAGQSRVAKQILALLRSESTV